MKPRADAKYVIGVDLGGTNVRAGVVDRNEKIIGQDKQPSDAKAGTDVVVGRIADTILKAITKANLHPEDIAAIGMAVPGQHDVANGVVRWAPNFGAMMDDKFQMWHNVPLRKRLEDRLSISVVFDNDANVAALGEFRYGAGRQVQTMVMFTLGTGIGGGIIINGKVVQGTTGGGGEIGHMVIMPGGRRCGCGTYGCLEAMTARDAISDRAARKLSEGRPSLLWDLVKGDKLALTPAIIDQAARANDPIAVETFQETGYYLGIGVANLINLINPEMVVVGGGIAAATGLLEATERSARANSIRSIAEACSIVRAELEDEAGIMGAAELASQYVAAG
ncbi:MAG: ROK family protein [Armatimonadetes bacterium]|nr:ROK family protein [Armatimonadota bacterium]